MFTNIIISRWQGAEFCSIGQIQSTHGQGTQHPVCKPAAVARNNKGEDTLPS